MHEKANGGATTVAEHEHRAAQGVLAHDGAADLGNAIHAAAKINRFDGDQDPGLRREGQHATRPTI